MMLKTSFNLSGCETENELRVHLDPEGGKSAIGSGGIDISVTRMRLMVIFGTRPEIIKLAPVIHALKRKEERFETIVVNTGQHTDLLRTFFERFSVHVDHDLNVMQPGQTPNGVCSLVLSLLDSILAAAKPDVVLVQGDTTTALGGALAAFHHRIPVGHVEAGLRSGDRVNPYPKEMNRCLITRLASFHFAATAKNRENLLAEGVAAESVFVTGNPVVDSLMSVRRHMSVSQDLQRLLDETKGSRRVVLTAHRRENHGGIMAGQLRAIRGFVERHDDVVLMFPVHPNPAVRSMVGSLLGGHSRIHLLEPLGYVDFIGLLSQAWLILSDSGGVQEEAPTLGKPLLVLRRSTERPEAIESGVARLVGNDAGRLESMLELSYRDKSWAQRVGQVDNPFGRGDSGEQIVRVLCQLFQHPLSEEVRCQ
jgi:UDP-N-acetylglucosamine 2-epimerase (non-hydrolysing)